MVILILSISKLKTDANIDIIFLYNRWQIHPQERIRFVHPIQMISFVITSKNTCIQVLLIKRSMVLKISK